MSVQIYVFCTHAFPWYMESEILPYIIYIYIYLSTDVFLNHAWNRSRGIGINLEHAYNKLGTFWEQAWIMSEQAWNMALLLRRWTCLEWACSKLDIGWGAYGHPSDGIQPIPWAPGGPHVIFFLRLNNNMQTRSPYRHCGLKAAESYGKNTKTCAFVKTHVSQTKPLILT